MRKSYIAGLVRRGQRAVDRYGLPYVCRYGIRYVMIFGGKLLRYRNDRPHANPSQKGMYDLDEQWQIHTGVHVDDDSALAEVDGPNWRHGFKYEPSPPKRFHALIKALPLVHEYYTFVDMGSGKGFALFLASEYPFEKIIGIEYCPSLHRIAEQNIAAYRNSNKKCHDIVSICQDAISFRFPPAPIVVYFACPFDAVILEKVIENLRRSLSGSSKMNYVIYYNARYADIFEKYGFIKIACQIDHIGTHRASMPSRLKW